MKLRIILTENKVQAIHRKQKKHSEEEIEKEKNEKFDIFLEKKDFITFGLFHSKHIEVQEEDNEKKQEWQTTFTFKCEKKKKPIHQIT